MSTSRASVHVRSVHLNNCIGCNQCHGSSVFQTCAINVVVFVELQVVLWYIECCGRVHRILQARARATVGRCLRPHERKPACNATIGVERAWTMQAETFERGIWHTKNVSSRVCNDIDVFGKLRASVSSGVVAYCDYRHLTTATTTCDDHTGCHDCSHLLLLLLATAATTIAMAHIAATTTTTIASLLLLRQCYHDCCHRHNYDVCYSHDVATSDYYSNATATTTILLHDDHDEDYDYNSDDHNLLRLLRRRRRRRRRLLLLRLLLRRLLRLLVLPQPPPPLPPPRHHHNRHHHQHHNHHHHRHNCYDYDYYLLRRRDCD